jgi:hypothetical protein
VSVPWAAGSRGSKSDMFTLEVTPCSNLTNTKPVSAGCATTAGSQNESHTHTVELRWMFIALTPRTRILPFARSRGIARRAFIR